MTIHKPRQGRDLDASDAQLTVLLASPERSDAVFVERLLSQRAQVVRALSCPEALALHDRGRFEVCLFDVELGEASMLRLLRTFRALELRGEARGGRFVSGWAGEQFATPGAIRPLRAARNRRRKAEEAAVGSDETNSDD